MAHRPNADAGYRVRVRHLLAILAAGLLLAGCAATSTPSAVPSTPAPSGVEAALRNPAVTQASVGATICRPGWTDTVRRPLPTRPGYQHDHRLPLELGGASSDPANLWFVPEDLARADDRLETALKRAVCAGDLTLELAQREILAVKAAHG